MKFDDLIYRLLEANEKRRPGVGAALGVGALGGAALAAMHPEKAAAALHGAKDIYSTHVGPHVNKALGGKSAQASPTHADMGAVPRGRVEPSHADQTQMGAVHRGGATPSPHDPHDIPSARHDIDVPDYGV